MDGGRVAGLGWRFTLAHQAAAGHHPWMDGWYNQAHYVCTWLALLLLCLTVVGFIMGFNMDGWHKWDGVLGVGGERGVDEVDSQTRHMHLYITYLTFNLRFLGWGGVRGVC